MGRARCPSHKSYFFLWDGHLARPNYFCKRSNGRLNGDTQAKTSIFTEVIPFLILDLGMTDEACGFEVA
jgi:hypothetical protein